MSEKEKLIYNTYLKYSRFGQPWNPRKNFDKIADENKFLLTRLLQFFNKFKHIKIESFFAATHFLHPEETYPPLKFFISRPAIKNYSLYLKQIENQSPENQIEFIKESFQYISQLCLAKKIQMDDYLNYREELIPQWIQDYRQHQISIYSVMELNPDLNKYEKDNLDVWVPGLVENFTTYKIRYHNSNITKNLVKQATTKIKDILKQTLN